MFTPTVTTDLDKMLDSLGTFYTKLDDTSKDRIKNFWTAMIESVGGMYYDLYQNHLAKYLYYTQGYIENRFQEYNVIFEGSDKNVEWLQFSAPSGLSLSATPSADNELYTYSVSCVTPYGETLASKPVVIISGSETLSTNPVSITWSLVSGIESYNVYGRTSAAQGLLMSVSGITYTASGTHTVVDSGVYTPTGSIPSANTATWGYIYTIPDDLCHFTMPTLSGITMGQVLTEGTDYEIEDLKKIKFTKPLSSGITDGYISYDTVNGPYEIGETYVAANDICLLPIINSIYFKGFGITNPADITNNSQYYPYLSGMESLSYYQTQTLYAQHLYHWSYAMSYVLRKPPTITNVKHGLGLVLNVPFNYYAGTVISIDDDENFKYISISGSEGNYTYKVPETLNLAYEEDDTVERFALLTDGTYVSDYLNDFTLVSGNTLKEGDIKEYDVFTNVYSQYDSKFRVLESVTSDITKVKTGGSFTFEA